jgi:hypothetical protein
VQMNGRNAWDAIVVVDDAAQHLSMLYRAAAGGLFWCDRNPLSYPLVGSGLVVVFRVRFQHTS